MANANHNHITLRQSLNTVTSLVEAAERWHGIAADCEQEATFGAKGAAEAAETARTIARQYERRATAAFGQAAFTHGAPREV